MNDQIQGLAQLTDMQFQAEMAKMQKLVAEENRLLQLLSELDARSKQPDGSDEQTQNAIRALGADLLWQTWVGQRRAALQMQLANLKARKEMATDRLRRAFGKASVAAELVTRDALGSRVNAQKRQAQQAQSWLIR
jgi:lipase chaperone LimK